MSVDIVIPLGNGSSWHNNELMYCLRGIEKHLGNYRNIYIIGKKPEWLTKDIVDYPHDATGSAWDKFNHERNIYEKIKFACNLSEVSERFLFMNDDHFLTADTDAATYPYYYRFTLDEKITARTRPDAYAISMRNTRDLLPPGRRNYFDIHAPIMYRKEEFIRVNSQVNWNKPMGYVIKSLYCNMLGIDGIVMSDLKMKGGLKYDDMKRKIANRHVFSIADSAINQPGQPLERLMNELYPEPSRWEVKDRVKSGRVKAYTG